MSAISLRQIEIFHAVMTTGSLTAAAILLHTSQPTVSRELARFEKQLQLHLFDRVKGRLHPTAQGLQLFEEVQRSYYGMERIKQAACHIRQFQQAQLSIACLPAFSQSLLPGVCHHFLTHYPSVSLKVTPQESPLLEEWLSAQRYDLGLTENAHPLAGTEHKTLATLAEVCVLPLDHPLLAKDYLTPQDFAHQRYISLSPSDSYRQIQDVLFHQQQVERQLILETHSAASICAMVRQGIGISIVNPLTALDFADHGVAWRPFSLEIPFTISLVLPKHRPSSTLVNTFIQYLTAQIAQISQQLIPLPPSQLK